MHEHYPLFSQVALSQDFPEYNLHWGDIATVVEYYQMTEQEDGYSLEGFNIPEITLEVAHSQIISISQWQKEQEIFQKIHKLSPEKLQELDQYINQLIA
ncbi:DUF4926 domain-containing protein [Picosynechococcus sp. PCC 7003]|uniref:DUF4926 domain-containing protein n=1 Tax=Picosynechococcus sp. PCC 7003 TaxID=374981 RepID=UPI000810B22D|nr:DUF4926 domain-containing protein [Picosynechococcus sp. PCC 7003]ANV85276.1 DUF4926 domain-containing protein [Picosynechococcus sp. PCC 7003]